jgi:hypothetical protein
MRLPLACALLVIALLSSCAGVHGPYDAQYQYLYGQRIVAYGDGRHPGAVFTVPKGTPVIAASDGEVTPVRFSSTYGGYYVGVSHGQDVTSWYVHLQEVHVQQGQLVKRGDFIGLTGSDYRGWEYLHFRLCQKAIFCNDFEYSLDPAKYWLGGRLHCFERGTDYSRTSQTEMTVPLACGDHARALLARAKAGK